MAVHKRITFQTGTLGRFIKKHGVTFGTLQVPPFMICMEQDHPGQKFFILTFRNREGRILKIPYMQGAAIEGLPQLEQSLATLAADAHIYSEYDTPEEHGRAFGEDEEDWVENFEKLGGLVEGVMKFFGEKAFNELMELTQGQDLEMEGDRGWWRQRTCG
jgi:hypothetical protein